MPVLCFKTILFLWGRRARSIGELSVWAPLCLASFLRIRANLRFIFWALSWGLFCGIFTFRFNAANWAFWRRPAWWGHRQHGCAFIFSCFFIEVRWPHPSVLFRRPFSPSACCIIPAIASRSLANFSSTPTSRHSSPPLSPPSPSRPTISDASPRFCARSLIIDKDLILTPRKRCRGEERGKDRDLYWKAGPNCKAAWCWWVPPWQREQNQLVYLSKNRPAAVLWVRTGRAACAWARKAHSKANYCPAPPPHCDQQCETQDNCIPLWWSW